MCTNRGGGLWRGTEDNPANEAAEATETAEAAEAAEATEAAEEAPKPWRGIAALLTDDSMTDAQKVEFFKEHLQNGDVRTTIDRKTQNRHRVDFASLVPDAERVNHEGLRNTKWLNATKKAITTGEGTPKSRLRKDFSAAKFLAAFAGKGEIKISRRGNAVHEFFTFRKPIGRTFDREAGKYVPAYVIQIKYTDNGVHIFPTKRTE